MVALASLAGIPAASAHPALRSAAGEPQPAGAHTVTVGDIAEAWYADQPISTCSSPIGCPPAAGGASPYPGDTLHVGVAGGRPTASTYLLPDLTGIPVGSTLTAATMTVPINPNVTDGTVSPGSAAVKACLVTQPIADGTDGSAGTPPRTSCRLSTVPLYDAKHNLLTVNLAAFLKTWSAGGIVDGIALLPDTSAAQPTDVWHLTIDGRKRAGSPHVKTAITYTTAATPVPSSPTKAPTVPVQQPPAGSAQPPVGSGGVSGSLPGAGTSIGAGGSGGASPEVAPKQHGSDGVPQARPAAVSVPFQYPMAFGFPLLLLAGGVFFARLFTRDATPRRSGS